MGSERAANLKESLTKTFDSFAERIIDFAPQLLIAILFLLFGWFIAHALRLMVRKLVGGLDAVFGRFVKTDGRKRESIKRSYALILSNLVFWTVMIFFIAATANLLEWELFSTWMDNVITFLPSLFAGLILILVGILLANGSRNLVAGTLRSAGMEQSDVLARLIQIVIIVAAILIGVGQIGINVHFITDALIVVIAVFLAGAALAFGLGAKTLVANVIGAQYARRHCRFGERFKMDGIEGVVAEITQTSIVLDTPGGRVIIPAKHFHEKVLSFSSVDEAITSGEREEDRGQ